MEGNQYVFDGFISEINYLARVFLNIPEEHPISKTTGSVASNLTVPKHFRLTFEERENLLFILTVACHGIIFLLAPFVRNFEYLFSKLWFDEQASKAWRNIIYATNHVGAGFEKYWECGIRFPAIFIHEGSSDFKLHNSFCIDGNPNSQFNFEPSDKSVWPGGQE